jgi:hypothetical protein
MKTDRTGATALTEELDALVHTYNHLRNEHKRARPESSVRRRIEERQLSVRQRFERVLDELVPDPGVRDAWRAHLDNRGPRPDEPEAMRPLVFRGRSGAGSVVEIRRHGDELDVFIDGALEERLDPGEMFESGRYRFGRDEFFEIFGTSDDALDALAAYRDDPGQPPWAFAAELIADGLVDAHFGLTPRGRRALEGAPAV